MVAVFNGQRNRTAYLENAFNIIETMRMNSIWTLEFTLPETDPKNAYCELFNYAQYGDGEMYRITGAVRTTNELGYIKYEAEHVLSLLLDNILLFEYTMGDTDGKDTKVVINTILASQQPYSGVRAWALGICDYNQLFQYVFENETLLSALTRVTVPLSYPSMWTFNTNVFPYVLNLELIDLSKTPEMYIRTRKNLLELKHRIEAYNVCTRLYPFGAGSHADGTLIMIDGWTGGYYYIQSPQSYITKYGIVERIWTDKRITTSKALFSASKRLLAELQEPYEEYSVSYAQVGENDWDKAKVGKIISVAGEFKSIIVGVRNVYDEMKNSTIEIANNPRTLSRSIANMT